MSNKHIYKGIKEKNKLVSKKIKEQANINENIEFALILMSHKDTEGHLI